jgi:metal-dependent amidase/aminoacylase/carboxypeptidase family protein
LSARHRPRLRPQLDCRHGGRRCDAAAEVADDLGVTISVVGTPAEELGGGGKILLLQGGAFAGVHAAMMVHPYPTDNAAPLMLANAPFQVRYTGKERTPLPILSWASMRPMR